MQNIHGGISFYCKGIEAPVTLGEKMYSKYNHLKTSQSLSLCVFMYFTDYLAFMKLQKKVSEFRQISCPDILIINDIDNYIIFVNQFISVSITCFIAGRTLNIISLNNA